MLKIGLTGGIGSGKSTVSSILKKKGIDVIDADVISREVLNIYPYILKNISVEFGSKFINNDGSLKRKEFGNFIFSSPKKYREKYEAIIMPYIKDDIFKRFKECEKFDKKICVLDAPTLIENNMHKDMDYTILVWVDEHTQMERVKSRDKLNEIQVQERIKAQIPLDKKRQMSDFIIDNTCSIKETEKQINKLFKFLINGL